MSTRHPRNALQRAWDTAAMAFVMAACCLALMLLVLVIPAVGWGPGLAVVAAGLLAVLFIHRRCMKHGH